MAKNQNNAKTLAWANKGRKQPAHRAVHNTPKIDCTWDVSALSTAHTWWDEPRAPKGMALADLLARIRQVISSDVYSASDLSVAHGGVTVFVRATSEGRHVQEAQCWVHVPMQVTGAELDAQMHVVAKIQAAFRGTLRVGLDLAVGTYADRGSVLTRMTAAGYTCASMGNFDWGFRWVPPPYVNVARDVLADLTAALEG